jgi:hypothetical protein
LADHRERPVVALLIAAALVALLTLGVVLRFGLVGPPELAPVDEVTRPTVELAVLTYRDRDRGQCLDVVGVDGSVREVRCTLDGVGPLLGWDDRGILVLRYSPVGERLEVLDPQAGALVASGPFDPAALSEARWADRWAGGVDIERTRGTLTVRDEQRRVLWEVDAPDNYWINASARDHDSGTVALLDSAGRLLVLRPGADEPSVWVADLGTTYGEIVWQGTRLTSD